MNGMLSTASPPEISCKKISVWYKWEIFKKGIGRTGLNRDNYKVKIETNFHIMSSDDTLLDDELEEKDADGAELDDELDSDEMDFEDDGDGFDDDFEEAE